MGAKFCEGEKLKRHEMFAAPRRQAGCEKPKASRPAVTGPLAKTNISLPVASSRPGTRERRNVFQLPQAQPPSPRLAGFRFSLQELRRETRQGMDLQKCSVIEL